MVFDYVWFKQEVFAISGIDLNCYKEKQMKRRIDSLIGKNGCDGYETYIREIKARKDKYNEFINYLTINVSEFYRNPDQWNVLENDILPTLLSRVGKPKIWSSACSTGDEPYTLAMVLSKLIPLSSINIIATDIDKGTIEKAAKGIYSAKSLESLPAEYMKKHFIKTDEPYSHIKGDSYIINDNIKSCVRFSQMNLLADIYPPECDLIMCRNVLIYFTEEAKNKIYINMSKALKNNAYLFIGSTEQIMSAAIKYKLKPVRTFFYTKDESL